jgi:DNA repair protein RadC
LITFDKRVQHLTSLTHRLDQIPEHDRPREKLIAKGAASLSDKELIAILLGTGTNQVDVMGLAGHISQLVDEKGLDIDAEDLMTFEGIGPAKASVVVAAIEFARRRIKPRGVKLATPADVLPLIRNYADRRQEHFLSVSINGANEILNVRVVSIGLLDRAPVHPREVFADVLTDRASGVVVAHNHPEGALEPSTADVEITRQLKQSGEILGITLLDHIIFNGTDYFSFLESGKL